MNNHLLIFALGGNDVSPTGKVDPQTGAFIIPDLNSQWKRAAETCHFIVDAIRQFPERQYIITHGNGPQVGNILLRSEYSTSILHPLTLDVCVADAQGGMGYMLAQINNLFQLNGIKKIAAETITQVVVNADDPAMQNPDKFIGSALSKEKAMQVQGEGKVVKLYQTAPDGQAIWRRVVPSPAPIDIIELEVVACNLKQGIIPITVGGGGIPVVKVNPRIEGGLEIYDGGYGVSYQRPVLEGQLPADIYRGVEAVIDKDLSSALLGQQLIERARTRGETLDCELIILTGIDAIKLNFQTPQETTLKRVTLSKLKALLATNQFQAGSMRPKVQAAINFLEAGGKKVRITTTGLLEKALKDEAGTTIVPD